MDKTIQKTNNTFIAKLKKLSSGLPFLKRPANVQISEKAELLSEIETALSDLRYARNCFETANDPEMIEACIYEIKSAEARYSFLLRKAKRLAKINSASTQTAQ